MTKNFKTIITALCTPFKSTKVDWPSLEKLVDDQLSQGVGGFVINGTTGESPTLSQSEVKEIFSFVRKKVPQDFPLIIGTGSNCTQKTIENGRFAKELGADAALVVVPYYNKPPQRGLVAHFTEVATASEIPVILYNVPGRTITSLSYESIAELAKHPNIIGIKEASGDIALAEKIAKELPDFLLLSGDDGSFVDFLKVGGQGVISVSSHIIGKEMSQWQTALSKGEAASDEKFQPFLGLLGIEANPIPLKMALKLKGIIESAEMRLPLVELSPEATEKLSSEMNKLGMIK